MMTPSLKIKPPHWMRDPDLVTILTILNDDNINARMVGGAIRNMLTNKDVIDIDIACILKPNITQEKLTKNGIKTIPTGIDHGTITAHINGKNYEITTLRCDIETDGRHASVDFTTDWVEDAKRRDFTINALYADLDGSIYDPLGTGLNDIQNNIVQFIGDPHQRITEDSLRILRFFRFDAQFNKSDAPHNNSFQACKDHAENINNLSHERICDEIQKIMMDDHAPIAIDRLRQANIFDIDINAAQYLSTLITLQNQLGQIYFAPRLNTIGKIKKYFNNKKLNSFIEKIETLKKQWDGNIKTALYYYDRDIVIQTLLSIKSHGTIIHDHIISDAMTLPKPKFPITAHDIMTTLNIPQGPQVGQAIKKAENIWINSDFKLQYQDILDRL